MSAQIICSGLAQAAPWATSMPTITAGTRALSVDLTITERVSWQPAEPPPPADRLEMSDTTPTVLGMNEPPRRHDISIRVPTEPSCHPDPAAFAIAASRAAAVRDASVLSAHTAEEIICVVSVSAATGQRRPPSPWPSWPTRSRPGRPCRHPAGERVMPAVVRGLVEGRLPELVVAGVAGDRHVSHAPPTFCGFPGGRADTRLPAHPCLARPQLVTERAALRLVLEQRDGHLRDPALACRYASTARSRHVLDLLA